MRDTVTSPRHPINGREPSINYGKVIAQCENARLIDKLNPAEVRTFEGWKAAGRFVRKGERQRAFRVQAGYIRTGIDPISGEDRYEPLYKTAYGFHVSQTEAYGR